MDIFFQGKNLMTTNENIRIYTVKFINTGNQTILEDFYAQNDNFGLIAKNGIKGKTKGGEC